MMKLARQPKSIVGSYSTANSKPPNESPFDLAMLNRSVAMMKQQMAAQDEERTASKIKGNKGAWDKIVGALQMQMVKDTSIALQKGMLGAFCGLNFELDETLPAGEVHVLNKKDECIGIIRVGQI